MTCVLIFLLTYSKTPYLDHLKIRTTSKIRPLFLFPIFTLLSLCYIEPQNKDHLTIKTTFSKSQRWSKYRGFAIFYSFESQTRKRLFMLLYCFLIFYIYISKKARAMLTFLTLYIYIYLIKPTCSTCIVVTFFLHISQLTLNHVRMRKGKNKTTPKKCFIQHLS